MEDDRPELNDRERQIAAMFSGTNYVDIELSLENIRKWWSMTLFGIDVNYSPVVAAMKDTLDEEPAPPSGGMCQDCKDGE